jgi:DNA helicase-2/ATP-dependent DNA helicase PcrA
LDEEQHAAVTSDKRAIAVLAGPGSGKTRVLSYRARHLLSLDRHSSALLLTFTNKAAAEMKARALGVAAVTSDHIWASTFHTFGMRLLHAHGDLVGISREFELLDEEERAEVAAEAARNAGVSDRYRRWSYLRLRRQQAQEPEVVRFGRAYQEIKRARQVLDFDDLIVYSADLFEQHDQVAEAYATLYRHLLVDEFQDTNAAQFAIVHALARNTGTVSVFADDDQAIYRFAGAEAENIRRFIADLGAAEYPLTINYRCRQAIVDCANRLIAADRLASGRQMRAFHAGGDVRTLVFQSVEEEAQGVADEISVLIARQVAHPPDIAVLVRAAFRVQQLLGQLERSAIPVSNWLGQTYEPSERQTLRTILSVLRGRLGDRQARRLCSLLGLSESDERDPLAILVPHSDLPSIRLLLELRELAWTGAPVRDVVEGARAAAAAIDPVLGHGIAPLVETVAAFEEYDPHFTLEHFVAELALGGIGGPPTVGGGVKIASLHRTKGLQWPHVYMLGLEEGRLPDYRAQTQDTLREERRACYVGVCRAEQHLTLTRTRYYGVRQQRPSRFLQEMGLE